MAMDMEGSEPTIYCPEASLGPHGEQDPLRCRYASGDSREVMGSHPPLVSMSHFNPLYSSVVASEISQTKKQP